jgi:uncharacterized protein
MISRYQKPTPDVNDPDYAPFWAACNENRLVVQQCEKCNCYRWPPRPICSNCLSSDVSWVPAQGTGRIHTWTAVGRAFQLAFADAVPYYVAFVELDQPSGIRLIGNVVNVLGDLSIGQRVEVQFKRINSDVVLPIWKLAA